MTWDTRGSKIGSATFVPSYKIGGYIEQPYTREFTDAEMQQIRKILDEGHMSGMDHWYLRVNSSSLTCETIIDWIKAEGSEVIVEPNDANGEQAIIDKFGDDVIAAFLNQDDQGGKPLDQCIERYNYLKANWPHIPVYSTGEFVDASSLEKRGWADLVAQQNYQSGRHPVISNIVRLYTAGRIPGKPFIANPQSFVGYENVFPSAEDMYAYGVLALIFCDAICWYTFFSPEMPHNITDYDEHWRLIRQLTETIRAHEIEIVTQEKEIVVNGEHVICTWEGGLRAEVKLEANPRIIGSVG